MSEVKIAWGRKVSKAFKEKVLKMADFLRCDPNDLMACMAFESGETFSPSIRNPHSSATGLIQFMRKTAISLGTTVEDLAAMTAEEQLDWVLKYFTPFVGKLLTLADIYMAILYPKAVGKPESFVLFRRPSAAYRVNAGLDANGDGVVTKAEAAAKVYKKLVKGLSSQHIG